jgi:uncharacterized membrane protein YdjX (TVP38/TMEM64 family)
MEGPRLSSPNHFRLMTPSSRRGPSSSRAARSRSLMWTIVWIFVALALLALAYPQMRRLPETLNSVRGDQIRAAVARWGPWGPLVAIVLLVVHTFVPFPGELVMAANGAVFGLLIGLGVSWVGNVLSAVLAFELGHLLGPSHRLPSTVPQKALKWVDEQIRERDWRVAIVMRFVPLFPVSVFNFALGRMGVDRLTFLWTTALGILPMNAVLVAIGYGATGAGELLPWAMAALMLFIIFGLVFRYRLAHPAPARAKSQ